MAGGFSVEETEILNWLIIYIHFSTLARLFLMLYSHLCVYVSRDLLFQIPEPKLCRHFLPIPHLLYYVSVPFPPPD